MWKGLAVATMLAAGLAAGCASAPKEAAFDSAAPHRRTEALTSREGLSDPSTIEGRISLLDSDDPLVRMLAIRSLERMTGETFGYDHASGQLERDEAVDRWVEWYELTGGVEQ